MWNELNFVRANSGKFEQNKLIRTKSRKFSSYYLMIMHIVHKISKNQTKSIKYAISFNQKNFRTIQTFILRLLQKIANRILKTEFSIKICNLII